MENIENLITGSWMVTGDFNTITTVDERSGGSPPITRNMEEFNEAISLCGLSSLEFDGPIHTWTNGVLWQRLDRTLINDEWGDLFEVSKTSHLDRGRSDHALLLLKCGSSFSRGTSFRFLNVWRSHPQFVQIVKEAWDVHIQASGMERFF
ncbi:uncharacterized protein [Coffea arabica]|uniref:Endonuclease/exonuclease/phosphatase domain-containing protein n=1 Tax=Coffea arabica TaxID=13443 RepID=A0ABM4W8B1_COFAR